MKAFFLSLCIFVLLSQLAIAADNELFLENFDNDRWGWSIVKDGKSFDACFDEGKYLIENKAEDGCVVEMITLPYSLPENFEIELISLWKAGREDAEYGLAIGVDSANYYLFGISGNGKAGAQLVLDGERQEPNLLDMKQGKALQGDGSTENLQKVEVQGNFFSYYVNDKYIGRIKNKEIFVDHENLRIAVLVCSKQKIAFDQLSILGRKQDKIVSGSPDTQYEERVQEEKPPEISKTTKREREGFFLGFGLGPGKMFSDEAKDFTDNTEGILVDLRSGAGISENFLLFGEITGLTIPQDDDSSLNTYHYAITGQYFISERGFLKFGVGFGTASVFSSAEDEQLDTGLALVSGVGYEFRFGEMFALSLGCDVNYLDSSDLPGTMVGLNMGCLWYW
jgi:hypothetical protein